MTNQTTLRGIRAAIAAGVLLLAPGALAQEDAAPPVLKGPEVKDTPAPGSDTRFSPGMERAREAERPVPLRVYERILEGLRAPAEMSDATDDRPYLSAEQASKIESILSAHRRAMREFMQEHREELEQLRRDAGQASPTDRAPAGDRGPARDGDGNRPANEDRPARQNTQDRARPGQRPAGPVSATPPGSGKGVPEAAPAGVRERMQALRAKGPQESAAIEQIWGVLTEAQRAHVEGEVEKYRAEMMRRREMEKLGERTDQKPGESARPARDVDLDRLPERVRERLEQMSPEERERALRRLRERREQQAGRDAPARRDKPAPSMDEVELPGDD